MNVKGGTPTFPPFAVLWARGGSIVYPPGSRLGPRLQTTYQLVLLHSGSAAIELDGQPHELPPESVALLKPGHQEYFSFADTQETRHSWIHIACDVPNESIRHQLEGLPFCLPLTDSMKHLTEMLLSAQIREQADDALIRSLGQSAMLLYISESGTREAQRTRHYAVTRVKSLIEMSYSEHLALAELAQTAGVTAEHLVRLFRSEEGTTPMRYLWRLRIRRGIELLRSTGLSIGEVAERSGFQTSYHFARMIKQHTGLTPTDIRKQSWLGNVSGQSATISEPDE